MIRRADDSRTDHALVEDVPVDRDDEVTEADLDVYDADAFADGDGDVVWVPPEQPAKRGLFALHEGELVLLAVCDDCGKTTHTTAEEHLFVPCSHCPGEITLTWESGEG